MKYLNKGQLIAINTLVSKLHIDKESKMIMVQGFTNNRETSTTKLTSIEAIEMIKHLKDLDPEEKEANKMRRKIIAIARSMGWEKNFVVGGSIAKKADMQRIDNWCTSYGHMHKKLNQYLLAELPKLVSQMEQVEKSFLKSI